MAAIWAYFVRSRLEVWAIVCQFLMKLACLHKALTSMARCLLGLLELVEAWTLEGHDERKRHIDLLRLLCADTSNHLTGGLYGPLSEPRV